MKNRIAKKDFSINDLPKNRKELFGFILKNRWKELLYIGFFLIIGFIPIVTAIVGKDTILINAQSNSQELYENYYLIINLIYSAVIFLCLYIFAVPLSGALRIIRQIAWNKEVFFSDDFIKGMKDNYKTIAKINVFVGIVIVIGKLTIFFSQNEIVYFIIFGIFTIIVLPVLLMVGVQNSIYNNSFKQSYKNGILLFIKNAPAQVSATLLLVSGFSLRFISLPLLKYSMIILFVLIIVPIALVILYLVSNSVFDKYINQQYHPELANEGLSSKFKED